MQPGMTPMEMDCAASDHDDPRCRAVLADLQSRVGARLFALWFEDKVRVSISGEQLSLAVGSPFLLNCIQKQYRHEPLGAIVAEHLPEELLESQLATQAETGSRTETVGLDKRFALAETRRQSRSAANGSKWAELEDIEEEED